jgi:Kef-type K+ transport system membrane component KefB
MTTAPKIHPHDVGLPAATIRKRRRSRRLGIIMLSIALVTAGAGWFLFGTSIFNAIHIKAQSPSLAIFAYGFLIVSSVTLVLGLWYLLLTQVERLARIVDAAELEELHDAAAPKCGACHRKLASSDRFCAQCGAEIREP